MYATLMRVLRLHEKANDRIEYRSRRLIVALNKFPRFVFGIFGWCLDNPEMATNLRVD